MVRELVIMDIVRSNAAERAVLSMRTRAWPSIVATMTERVWFGWIR